MKYLSDKDVRTIKFDWNALIHEIVKSSKLFGEGDFSQPVKPYLRYRDLTNRIIAMPAFIGGDIDVAGIKWIASFPGNIAKNIDRAHSTIILNEADTGIPYTIINSPYISGLRTASVTGSIIMRYLELKKEDRQDKYIIGMTGYGPIGQLHLEMIEAIMGDQVEKYLLYDLRPQVFDDKLPDNLKDKVRVCSGWAEAFDPADIFCTCTVSKTPYINHRPKPGSLHLNVSLRDYEASFMDDVDLMIIDDWAEVCREKTDIEMMHLEKGLQQEDTINIAQFLHQDGYEVDGQVLMFNPMGLAIYDMAIAKIIYDLSNEYQIGTLLD